MNNRWKLELWLDADGAPTQVNLVVVDDFNRLLQVTVCALPEDRELAALTAELHTRLLGYVPQQRLAFDLDDLP